MISARAGAEQEHPGTLRRSIGRRGLLGLALLSLTSGCAHPLPAEGLRPLPLLMVGGWTNDPITREVDSLKPTLRWEFFPRPEDFQADTEGRLGNVHSVTYELRIWRAEYDSERDYVPAELVYTRTGLTEAVHTVETPFAPDTLYLWTIRAHFDLNGRPRVTKWGALTGRPLGDRAAEIPHRGYYRLRTPQQQVP